MAGTFDITVDKAGEYRFLLRAGNGEPILKSEGYKQKASAENGIASVKINSQAAQRYERKETSDEQYMFNLKGANHEIIGTSERYASVAARENGIRSVKDTAPTASIHDKT